MKDLVEAQDHTLLILLVVAVEVLHKLGRIVVLGVVGMVEQAQILITQLTSHLGS